MTDDSTAIVIGGGIAGCSVAYALAQAGFHTTIIEQEHALASQASGNPRGICMPHVGIRESPFKTLYNAALTHVNDILARENISYSEDSVNNPGALQFLATKRLRDVHTMLRSQNAQLSTEPILSAFSAEESGARTAGLIKREALWVPQALVISPPWWCQLLVDRAPIKPRIVLKQKVHTLVRTRGGWECITRDDSFRSNLVILATAYARELIPAHATIKLEPVKGQITRAFMRSKLKLPALCYDGYFLSDGNGNAVIGASYRHNATVHEPTIDEHSDILMRARRELPEIDFSEPDLSMARASFRTSTHDRLPYIGELPDAPHCFVTLGHGSKGLSTGPLAGELIRSLVTGDKRYTELLAIVSPSRRRIPV
jgi:tRNA 5-methylaminomethyl-2-thiouridine biosynthesis bifunctional protein